ncbi:MAG: PIG-L deacetylase family protein, partial [bacterium]
PDRREVLVLEPHMDDAVLSVGGAMWARRATTRFTLITLCGRSNYTSYYDLDRDYFDVERISALRSAESALAMRMLGGRHEALGLLEAPLRLRPGHWSLDWFRHNHKLVDAFIMHASPPSEVELWASEIERVLRSANADEVWLPLGVGTHTDHELTRNACLLALDRVEGIERRTTVVFYQDVPYAVQFPEHTASIVSALVRAGGALATDIEDIGEVLPAKLRLVSVFGSQFKPAYMSPIVEQAARRAAPAAELSELRFRAERLPRRVDPVATYSRCATIQRLAASLERWSRRHQSASRIRVLSPVPIARWADDMSFLLDAFPLAAFDVHVSAEYAAETESLASPRLDVRIVKGREVAWLTHLVRCALSRAVPTIVLTGEGLAAGALLAKAMFVASDVIVATRLNDVVMALRSVRSGG